MDNRSFEIEGIPFLIERQSDLSFHVTNQDTVDLEFVVEPSSVVSQLSYIVKDIAGFVGRIDREEHGWVYYRRPIQTRIPLVTDELIGAVEKVAIYEIQRREIGLRFSQQKDVEQ